MNPRHLVQALANHLRTRQLRRGHARRMNRLLQRRVTSFAPESLEVRAMMSTTTGDLGTATTAIMEPAAYMATVAVPRTFTITWAWNENRTITDFNPKADVLALDWFSGSDLRLVEESGSAVLTIPSMQQSYRLAGVTLASLTSANFTCKDPSATAYISGVVASAERPAQDGVPSGAAWRKPSVTSDT
ncbi:MAG: hypothetical protein ACKOK8_00505, partial [Planctomycetia bacterium]